MTLQQPILGINGLSKTYGSYVAVNNLSLSVEAGEIFGILGSNGAGKTTSVECAQGLRRPDAGTIEILGHDPIKGRTQLRGRVGSQLQDANLPDRLRVGEAIGLFANSKTRASEAMSDWGLADLEKTPFAGLSGGQRQRLFLALALLNRPEIVFLDELTQGLDPHARRSVWSLIEQVRERGTTVVLVTHFMEEAEVLCDRVAVMTAGELVALGTPTELIERYGPGVRMRFGADRRDVEWLERVQGVASATMFGTEVELSGSSQMIAHVGSALVGRGAVPPDIRVTQPDLERALLELIEQPHREHAEQPQGAMA